MPLSPEEAQAEGKLNLLLENNLSSVKIIHKVEMKTGISRTEWEIKGKNADVEKAKDAVLQIDEELINRYESKEVDCRT